MSSSTPHPQYIEINDAMDCDIYLGSTPTVPGMGQGRVCEQCHHATWLKTSTCMWCGFDKMAKPARIALGIALALIICALLLRPA